MTNFTDLKLIEPLQRALSAEGYTQPTPIQDKAIPHLLEGRDLLGLAQTGTGKTAAFALPILQALAAKPGTAGPKGARTLVLTPTRELAVQIEESFRTYGRHLKLICTVVFGGVGQQPQVNAMRRGVDVLVATPGRLLDLMQQGYISLDRLEVFVLDEADRMLDMGFIHDIRKIMRALPKKRQTMLFSATMPDDIAQLAAGLLTNPVRVEATPVSSTAERIAQSVMHVAKEDKRALLAELMKDAAMKRVIVFTRTKHGADRVAEYLARARVGAEAIHGNKSQSARQRALANFKAGTTRVLVATDIAARGIDVDGITHVVNFELPNLPESYVHRIGRTARASAEGIAISFCDHEERAYLRDIEKLIRQPIPAVENHPYRLTGTSFVPKASAPRQQQRPPAGRGRNNNRGGGRPSGRPQQRATRTA